jgi:hypothetical protein
MKTSEREKRKLVAEWRLIADLWKRQSTGETFNDSDHKGRTWTKEQRKSMAVCLSESADELESMLS